MIRVAICDDEKKAREQLRSSLERFAQEQGCALEVLEYASADALLQNYPAGLDLLLLDIYMGGVDGMAAAAQIRTFDPEVCLIFITTMYQRAIEGYAVRAFGFIKKPVSYPELRHELACALSQIRRAREETQSVFVRSGGVVYRLPVGQIYYCEVQGHTMRICFANEVQECRCTIKELEVALQPHGFFRCHAAYLVNGKYVDKVGTTELVLTNGIKIPVSQRRRKEFLSALAEYMGEWL